MPIFDISSQGLLAVEQINFPLEKDLQVLIEKNLKTVFNCQFIASEFSTGSQHAGRIDSLALSEENNPVIIEYKKVESSELINQSLFYLHWIQDHKGDFEIAVQKKLGGGVKVDWSDVRVICIAPNYKKYDLHAVQVMGANIELWKYRLFSNNSIYLEEIFHISRSKNTSENKSKNVYKKSLPTNSDEAYSVEKLIKGKSKSMVDLTEAIREFIINIDGSIEEAPKKHYIAYKGSQNIVCVEIRNKNIKLWIKLPPSDVPNGTENYRNVASIGHFGTGDVEFTISTTLEFEPVKNFITLAYNKIGG